MRFSIASLTAVFAFGIAPGVFGAEPNVVGYYASWNQQETVGVDFSKYTHINLAFGIPAKDGSISFDPTLSLPNIVGQIHGNGTKALVSLGGWTDSCYFSTLVKDTSASNPFITNIVNFVESNSLDGIDIDWEYPGRAGNDGNIIDEANDTPNYLKFVTNLRSAFTAKFGNGAKLITMAVRVQPFDVNGSPSSDVSGFAKVVDFANIMQYDINGAWLETTGPNAPLNFEVDKATPLSFVTAIDAWTGAGWPASQLNVGLAFYGRATNALVDMTLEQGNQYQAQQVGVLPNCGGETDGVWQWKNLRAQGVLTSPDTAAAPWVRYWDDVTQTPWLFNPTIKQFVSYDDPKSIGAKINFAKSKGIGGAMVWSMDNDYKGELLDTIHSSWGGSSSGGNVYSTAAVIESTPAAVYSATSDATESTPAAAYSTTSDAIESTPAAAYSTTSDAGYIATTIVEAATTTEYSSTIVSVPPVVSYPPSTTAGDTNASTVVEDATTEVSIPESTDVNTPSSTDENSDYSSPSEDAPCTEELKYVCGSEDGAGSAYYICLFGSWIKLSCASGTACFQQNNFISCGWPTTSSA
ncbi:hypothetical protein IW140_006384 [Coemansia sp. RSA 1813]|nr:hypothetical protein EV178_006364 [Coemansia sp. RSA 1646]KAJ1765705.1 hypothetical protein LPJ74_006246 [Coemansia sp. RSA 1843]KAJ2085410.1 hypothetical protein IW138_006348 [Coemansia sp. RSA 986]KAJ2210353.1 hypothetical protein EV179_006302 [Coemansia sp. RSA 487]KAJ2562568.1 hypothetical protein IW140_006384 [Coemansia sp. RSA 1813]